MMLQDLRGRAAQESCMCTFMNNNYTEQYLACEMVNCNMYGCTVHR